jgi:hypothetical protein
MQRSGFTRVGMAISLAAAIGLGYIAYLQYRLAEVNSLIATTISGAQKAAQKAGKLQASGDKDITVQKVAALEDKGWELSDDNKSYEYKNEGAVYASVTYDPKTGKVAYRIDCGSFENDSAKQECSDVLDGTGKNYVDANDVPW